MSHWQEITDFLLPRSGRYFETDRNRDGRHHYNEIIDSSGTDALDVIASGMLAGASSPARPWFRFATSDPDLNQFHRVRLWLDDTRDRVLRVFNKSNTYRAYHNHYEQLAAFGTSASVLVEDHENVVHHYQSPLGEFALGTDFKGNVDTIYRRFQRTVGEVVREFGRDRVSHTVSDLFDKGRVDGPVQLLHVIEPRDLYDSRRRDSRNMPWLSAYIEIGKESDKAILRESGYRRFPAMAPRWAVNPGDIYGNSPGMRGLGDIKQLQHEQMRKGELLDFATRPPVQVPTSIAERDREMFPGGIIPYDQMVPSGGVRAAWESRLDPTALIHDIEDVRTRIRRAFKADMFLMLAQPPAGRSSQMTATEVLEKHEEKLLQLGPTMERVHNELLEPSIDQTFILMWDRGMFLPPPPELQGGEEIAVEFISILAQAQAMIGMNAIDRWTTSVLAISEAKPEILDKLDVDAYADEAADRLGVDPGIVVSNQGVKQLREARARAQAQKEEIEAAQGQARAAKDLAAADTAGDNALTEVMANLTSL
jgi:hypothetical protein